MSFLTVTNLSKHFGKTKVFEHINFTIPEGELITLLGASGCGKSTLLRCIAGLADVDSGQISVAREDITHVVPQKRGIGMVFQSYALFPNLTVIGNIAFGLKMQGVPAVEIEQRVTEVVALVELQGHENKFVHQLAIRTAVTYHLGMTYGAFGHEAPNNFHRGFDHGTWLSHLHQETTRSSDAFVSHYQQKYLGFPTMPIWMMTEVISLGSLSRMYKGMEPRDKQAVAAQLNIHHRRLQDWLHVLTYVRNVCAHHSRLWNRTLAIRPVAMSELEWSNPLLPRLDRVFCILLMLRYIMSQTGNGAAWRDECNALLRPIAATPAWCQAMGMGPNWATHPIWV